VDVDDDGVVVLVVEKAEGVELAVGRKGSGRWWRRRRRPRD
jgi:hypothetical protein